MITAEDNPRCVIYEDVNTHGQINNKFIGVYGETQIISYLKETVYFVNTDNVAHPIIKTPTTLDDQFVQIIYRVINGQRSIENGTDITKQHHRIIRIPLNTLREEPVFCEAINKVITLETHRLHAFHPHSKKFVADRLDRIQSEAMHSAVHMPLVIMANDPSGIIQRLFIQIHGRICTADVTHFKDEPDNICVGYRDVLSPGSDHHRIRTTFTELRKQDPFVWTIENCTISSHRDMLKKHNEIHIVKANEEAIPISVHISKIEEVRKLGFEERDRMADDLALTKKKLATEIAKNGELIDGNIAAHEVQLKIEELSLERARLENQRCELANERELRQVKLQQDQLKLEQDRIRHLNEVRLEKQKMRREYLSTIGSVFKTAAIVIPIAFGIYRALKTK